MNVSGGIVIVMIEKVNVEVLMMSKSLFSLVALWRISVKQAPKESVIQTSLGTCTRIRMQPFVLF